MEPLNPDEIAQAQKNEETTKLNFITPVLKEKWKSEKIIMEYPITEGTISVDEYGIAHRGKKLKADYLLLWRNTIPLAIVEAKGSEHSADDGFQQVQNYCKQLDVPFGFSTNGHDLLEWDKVSGMSSPFPQKLKDIPTPNELWQRYMRESHIPTAIENDYVSPYFVTKSGKKPRYYQRIAINRVTRAILQNQKRILLVMATGTGKTFTAFQLVWRFLKTHPQGRVLYLADRNILIDQTMANDFRPLSDLMVKVNNNKIDTAHQVYFALYQQLQSQNHDYFKEFPRNFFDLIIVDECHRGSANADSNWRSILDWFNSATIIGMTATPKDDADPDKSNIHYFGEPVYTYSLKQGIEDGFLAPYKVVVAELNIDKNGWLPPKGFTDINGRPVERRTYHQEDFDRTIIVDERRITVAQRITDFMKANDMRFAKTIVFCEDINHAEAMTRLLGNDNADLMKKDSRYVMQITGDNDEGKKQLDNFIDPSSKYPVIAVTSRLMSTGVDAQTCKLIVLDRNIGSMTEFKQIIGRGTRVNENYEVDGNPQKKMYFTILDFRKNYEKFSDPAFDGEPTDILHVPNNQNFPKPPVKPRNPQPPIPQEPRRTIRVHGVNVTVIGEIVQYFDEHGNLVKQNLTNCVRNNILTQYPNENALRKAWLDTHNKRVLAEQLLLATNWQKPYSIRFGYEIDDYDIIRSIAYGDNPPVSKRHRIESAPMHEFLKQQTPAIQQLDLLLLEAYKATNFDNLRTLRIFEMPQFKDAGWTKLKAVQAYGGKEKYYKHLYDLENALYTKGTD